MSLKSVRINVGRLLGYTTLVISLVLVLAGAPASAAASEMAVSPGSVVAGPSAVTIDNIMVSGVNDVKFTVSWTTTANVGGLVRWGTTPDNLDRVVVDPVGDTYTPYVTIEGLSSSTQYFFVVESDGTIGDDDGQPFSVTTGPTLGLPSPGAFVYGYAVVNSPTMPPVPNAVVYLRIEDNDGVGSPGVSQWVSTRTDANGGWYYSLSGLRTLSGSEYFSYSVGSDKLYYWGEDGFYGNAGVTPTLEGVVPVPGGTTQLPNLLFVPVSVTIESFEALQQGVGILTTWRTVSEIDNQGFNLFRATDPNGPRSLLAYVPSQAPGSAQGFDYQWFDTDVISGETYYYWLEDIDLAGAGTMHGPVSATYQTPTAVVLTDFTAPNEYGFVLPLSMLALSVSLVGGAYALRRRQAG